MTLTIRCPLCTTMTKATRGGHIRPHLNPGGVKCHAVGMDIHQGIALRKSIDKEASNVGQVSDTKLRR